MTADDPYSAEKAIAHWQRLTWAAGGAATTDEIMNICEDGECSLCAVMWCRHQEPLHFHPDGCPACTMEAEA